MFRLIGTSGNRYYSQELPPGEYVVGRPSGGSDCNIIVADATVSRHHAKLEVIADCRCFISDLGSHNGTYVNGEKIQSRIPIKPGDQLQFGSAEFRLIDDRETIPPTPKPTLTKLSHHDPERSVVLPLDEVLKPLPSRVTDQPEFLSTLFEMARMLVLPEPQETMLERTLKLVTNIIPADRLAVLFTSPDQNEVYTGALHLPQGKDLGTFTLSRTIVKMLMTTKSAVLIGNVLDDPRFADRQSIISSDLKSAMAVPLLDKDRVLGILYADTTNALYHYNNDYLRLFATFGNIIASRLTNYTLLKERHEKELFEAELKRASTIQKNLLPRTIPQPDYYSIHAFQEQCRAVGGDLYDVEMLPDGRIIFLAADISGKGMGAALLMSNILASFRILYKDEHFDLGTVIDKVSLELFEHSAPEHFATLFVGLLDPKCHTVTYINAGHNPALLLRENGLLEHLEASGTMIGAFDFSQWVEETVSLAVGDVLILFTDGVTEAEKGDACYSDERLEHLVIANREKNPEDIARIVMSDVTAFIEDTPRSDDITMLVMKRNS